MAFFKWHHRMQHALAYDEFYGNNLNPPFVNNM